MEKCIVVAVIVIFASHFFEFSHKFKVIIGLLKRVDLPMNRAFRLKWIRSLIATLATSR